GGKIGTWRAPRLIGARQPRNSSCLSPEVQLRRQVCTDHGHRRVALQQSCDFALGLTPATDDNTALVGQTDQKDRVAFHHVSTTRLTRHGRYAAADKKAHVPAREVVGSGMLKNCAMPRA